MDDESHCTYCCSSVVYFYSLINLDGILSVSILHFFLLHSMEVLHTARNHSFLTLTTRTFPRVTSFLICSIRSLCNFTSRICHTPSRRINVNESKWWSSNSCTIKRLRSEMTRETSRADKRMDGARADVMLLLSVPRDLHGYEGSWRTSQETEEHTQMMELYYTFNRSGSLSVLDDET